jgi:hypothetical protein
MTITELHVLVAAVCISCACSVMVEMPAWEITLLYPRSFHFLHRVETSKTTNKNMYRRRYVFAVVVIEFTPSANTTTMATSLLFLHLVHALSAV